MNRSKVKFLALLSALASCTPALGAMNNHIVDQYTVDRFWAPEKPDMHVEKINTFGTAELDLEAFIVMLNTQFSLKSFFYRDWEATCEWAEEQIRSYFPSLINCEFLISSHPWGSNVRNCCYKLFCHLPLKILKFRYLNDFTLEFDVAHGEEKKVYTIVGKRITKEYKEGHPYYYTWIFHVKNQSSVINKRFKNISEAGINSDKDIELMKNEIRRMGALFALRFLTRGANVQDMQRMLKRQWFFKVGYGRDPEGDPKCMAHFFNNYVLDTEKTKHGDFFVKLLDSDNFEYIYEKLDKAPDGFWDFQLMQKIVPNKKVELW